MRDGSVVNRPRNTIEAWTAVPPATRRLLPTFALTLLISAALLFWVQPLFGRLALPMLGGSPSIWNTVLLFFQTMLLAGYAYAHFLSRLPSLAWQVALHGSLLLIALATLPIAVSAPPPVDSIPMLWLLRELTVAVGLPFLAVSATAPLLQRWFSFSRHPDAGDPYFLYSVSNVGSVGALMAYPLLIEPMFGLRDQALAWAAGFAMLIALILLCGGQLRYAGATTAAEAVPRDPASWRQRLHWTLLAFAPSSLLLGVTTHLTTDVAAVPLLWVLPLTLYLVTFVIAFARSRRISHAMVLRLLPFMLVFAFVALQLSSSIWVLYALHLAAFFVLALACHGELVRLRPNPHALTEFYFAMGVGGALGGLFNAVIAPLIFVETYEYGLAIVAACLLRPAVAPSRTIQRIFDVAIPVALLSAIVAPLALAGFDFRRGDAWVFASVLIACGAVVLSLKARPFRFGMGVGAVLLGMSQMGLGAEILARERSFFGTYRVESSAEDSVRWLIHGTTLHGMQLRQPGRSAEPQGYYEQPGPLGQVFLGLIRQRKRLSDVGLVGLGAGASLCYARAHETWTAFEIDPLVVRIAQDPALFTYWADCAGRTTTRLVLGDARLSLMREPDQRFDLLILDAYNSDAVPIHLLTADAVALYWQKTKPGGLLAFHLTNRHLDLERVLGAIARDAGLAAIVQYHENSSWAVMARSEIELAFLSSDLRWRPARAGERAWTDDYSNILSVLK